MNAEMLIKRREDQRIKNLNKPRDTSQLISEKRSGSMQLDRPNEETKGEGDKLITAELTDKAHTGSTIEIEKQVVNYHLNWAVQRQAWLDVSEYV